jgi:4-hydroxybenzoate polyprenyltransferase
MVLDLIRLIRPKQWIKNLFVLGPIVFSKHLLEPNYLFSAILAFIGFCLISSTVYIINDIFDIESDRFHPKKKDRPIASGRISINTAIILATFILVISILIVINLKLNFIIILILYLLMNIMYSVWFKHVVILDVFCVAAGFMLRVIGGAVVIDVLASNWLIICTLFFSLFLGFAKRRSEISTMSNQAENISRKVLSDYSIPFIDQMLTITASSVAISYSLYTVSERTIKEFRSEYLIYTTVFVLYGIFRYLYLIITKNLGEDTAQVVLKDFPILLNIFFWLISCVFILYRHLII